MGFPVGYTDLFIPPLFLHTLTFFTLFRNLLYTLFSTLGLPTFLDPNPNPNPNPSSLPTPLLTLHPFRPDPRMTRELLTLVKVSDVEVAEEREECHSCSVCLYEVRGDDVIRWLDNCKHIFHRDCLDRWIELDHHTCPLCRTPFLTDDLVAEFNRRRCDGFRI